MHNNKPLHHDIPCILPEWQVPRSVHACMTTRTGGVSAAPYNSFNLGQHVGDKIADVSTNRARLISACSLPGEPEWLEQTHSNKVIYLPESTDRIADAAITNIPRQVLAIMTADCMPVLLANEAGDEIAAIHAGWRGLLAGIIENTLKSMRSPPETLHVWIGPAICKSCFEVGDDVKLAFQEKYVLAQPAFMMKDTAESRWLADLPSIARLIFLQSGVHNITTSDYCTFEQQDMLYSFRRDGTTGRMASLIWLNS